jgi:hypothetical protein
MLQQHEMTGIEKFIGLSYRIASICASEKRNAGPMVTRSTYSANEGDALSGCEISTGTPDDAYPGVPRSPPHADQYFAKFPGCYRQSKK